jgi:hypothetical protein
MSALTVIFRRTVFGSPSRWARCMVWSMAAMCGAALAQAPVASLEDLPRPTTPPPELGPIVPARVLSWRQQAIAYEHGDGVTRDPVRAAELYCRAARHGDAEAQYNLAWMLTNARGIERDDAQAAHLFAAAAEQGLAQAKNMLDSMGTPRGAPPACLRQPDEERPAPVLAAARPAGRRPTPAPPAHAGTDVN